MANGNKGNDDGYGGDVPVRTKPVTARALVLPFPVPSTAVGAHHC